MPVFEVRMQEVKATFSPFSSQSMLDIANVVLDKMKTRIKSVTDASDNAAKPLQEKYAKEKREGRHVALSTGKFRGLPHRDWTLRGRTLDACKVKYASQERATVGPTSAETGKIIMARNRIDKMWGVSPSDGMVLHKVIMATLQNSVRVERKGMKKIA